jgi:hypothetical protein
MELAFATTEELVAELISRTTFVGAVIQSAMEHRSPNTVHSHFQISTNLDDNSLSILLNKTIAKLSTGDFNKTIRDE